MSGIEIVAAVAGAITAFQGAAELTKKIIENKKRKKAAALVLQNELRSSLEKGDRELARCKDVFLQQFGNVGDYVAQNQLSQVQVKVEAIQMFLQFVYNEKRPLDDPSSFREQADWSRFTAINAMTELQARLLIARAMPTQLSPGTQWPPTITHDPGLSAPPPSGELPRIADRPALGPISPRSSSLIPPQNLSERRVSTESMSSFRTANMAQQNNQWQSQLQPTPLASRNSTALFSGSDREASLSNGSPCPAASPPRSPDVCRIDRASVVSSRTNSSSGSSELSPSRSKGRLSGFFSSRSPSPNFYAKSYIEQNSDIMRGFPNKSNDWHGFCEGAWKIIEKQSEGLEVIQRPTGHLYQTRAFYQCRKCAFRGPCFSDGAKGKTRSVDPKIYESATGIRYRWMFLAKSHVKCTESRSCDIDINTQARTASYKCIFCHLNHVFPPKLGGVESLLNHIYYQHRADLTDNQLARASCIAGRTAEPWEHFDINIPAAVEILDDIPDEGPKLPEIEPVKAMEPPHFPLPVLLQTASV